MSLIRLKHLLGQHDQKSHGRRANNFSEIINSDKVKSKIASAANKVLEDWQPDEEGFDEVFGGGGACDTICREINDVLIESLPDSVEIYDGGQDGDDHAWTIAYDGESNKAYGVDIPPGTYETGAGYSWQKIEGAKVKPSDVQVWEIPEFEPY